MVWIASEKAVKTQLLERGISTDTIIRYAFRLPLIHLSAYSVQESVFFLSRSHAREIFVEKF